MVSKITNLLALADNNLDYIEGRYKMRKLDFICVGFAKSGTTTLYNVLKQHPQIYLSRIKEPVFWNDKIALKRGKNWYFNRYYRGVSTNQIIGEINPQITNGAKHEPMIAQVLKKNGKIIFIMRNPVERLYSHFFMNLLWGDSDNTDLKNYSRIFDNFVEQTYRKLHNKNSNQLYNIDPFSFGNYSYYLASYRKRFGKENIFTLIFEEFIQDIHKSCKEVFDFLEISHEILKYNIKSNEGNYLPKNVMCMRFNGVWYNKIWPFICRNVDINQTIDEIMDKRLNWDMRTNRILLNPVQNRKVISRKSRILLQEMFAPEIENVENLLDRTLEGIWY